MEGARIERGKVIGAIEQKYIIQSLSRDGIITPPIPAINQEEFEGGEKVYFFFFQDGTGAVLGKIE
jgi:hypothetical protein